MAALGRTADTDARLDVGLDRYQIGAGMAQGGQFAVAEEPQHRAAEPPRLQPVGSHPGRDEHVGHRIAAQQSPGGLEVRVVEGPDPGGRTRDHLNRR